MPRPCPGSGCCSPAECLADCFCAIRIDMPDPDSVPEASGPSCPPADCDIAAKCWVCYLLLDGIFKKQSAQRYYLDDCGDIDNDVTNVTGGNCSFYSVGWGDLDATTEEDPKACWNPANYECPDCSTDSFLQCISAYGVKNAAVLLTITCEDNCCTAEIKIAYSVHQYCDDLVVLPDPNPVAPVTRYTHTFTATDLCSCVEVAGAVFTFSSTSSVNNSRGITVPDVCNVASAAVSLVGNDNCGCICFDCLDFSNDINVSLAGSEFTGTVVASYQPFVAEPLFDRNECKYTAIVNGATCQFEVRVYVTCLPCEKYNINVEIRSGFGANVCIAYYELLGTDCATLSGFTSTGSTGDCECDLTDFTISLS